MIDENGNAIITDFGLSKVIEEITTDNTTVGTSFFAGSTRWMAPELLLALIEDDGVPPITPASDVYAFASVCLEVNTLGSCLLYALLTTLLYVQLASGQLPYPHRSNDHAVTVDILRGIRPSRSSECLLKLNPDGEEAFWNLLDQCWSPDPCFRPNMSHLLASLEVLQTSRQLGP